MKQGAITTAPIQYFPLGALYLSDMNPRQDVDADRIDQLADSIVAVGLLQNLAGLARRGRTCRDRRRAVAACAP